MADGSVLVWNARALMKGAGDKAVLARIKRHQGAVRAVQFNPHGASKHLLATAGADGQVCIVNLANTATPSVAVLSAAGKGGAELTSLAWNTAVVHILATSAADGVVTVWDLKQNKPWTQLRDPVRNPVSAIAWKPDDGLVLVTATDDDARPVVRVWNLRSSTTTPIAELSGHTRGVLDLSWCPTDPTLLLSCGKDNRTLLWDLMRFVPCAEIAPAPADPSAMGGMGLEASQAPASATTLAAKHASAAESLFGPSSGAGGMSGGMGSMGGMGGMGSMGSMGGMGGMGAAAAGGMGAVGSGRRYQVSWAPTKGATGLVLACSLDRRIHLYSVVAAPEGRAPAWLARPASAKWGFGGRLARVGGAGSRAATIESAPAGAEARALVSAAAELEAALALDDEGLRQWCEDRADEAEAASPSGEEAAAAKADAEQWRMLAAQFSEDPRSTTLRRLGHDASSVTSFAATLTGKGTTGRAAVSLPGDGPDDHEAGGAEQAKEEPGSAAAAEGAGSAADHFASSSPTALPTVTDAAATAAALFGGPAGGGSASDLFGSLSGPPAAPNGRAASAPSPSKAAPAASSSATKAGGQSPTAGSAGPGGAAPGSRAAGDAPAPRLSPSDIRDIVSSAAGARLGQAPSEPPAPCHAATAREREAARALLHQAILSGAFESAVRLLLWLGRPADALLLSTCGGGAEDGEGSLWDRTVEWYLRWRSQGASGKAPGAPGTKDDFFAATSAIIAVDLPRLVRETPLEDWRDALALACTYAQPHEMGDLCEGLGDRLFNEGGEELQPAATLCYVCALRAQKAVAAWAQAAAAVAERQGRAAALRGVVAKACVLRRAVQRSDGASEEDARAVAAAAAGQGSLGPLGPGAPPSVAAGMGSQPEAALLATYAESLAQAGELEAASRFADRILSPTPGLSGAQDVGALLRSRIATAMDVSAPASASQFGEASGASGAAGAYAADPPTHAQSAAAAAASIFPGAQHHTGAPVARAAGGAFGSAAPAPAPSAVPAPAPAPEQAGYGSFQPAQPQPQPQQPAAVPSVSGGARHGRTTRRDRQSRMQHTAPSLPVAQPAGLPGAAPTGFAPAPAPAPQPAAAPAPTHTTRSRRPGYRPPAHLATPQNLDPVAQPVHPGHVATAQGQAPAAVAAAPAHQPAAPVAAPAVARPARGSRRGRGPAMPASIISSDGFKTSVGDASLSSQFGNTTSSSHMGGMSAPYAPAPAPAPMPVAGMPGSGFAAPAAPHGQPASSLFNPAAVSASPHYPTEAAAAAPAPPAAVIEPTAEQQGYMDSLRNVASMLEQAASGEVQKKQAREGARAADLLDEAIRGGKVSDSADRQIGELAAAVGKYDFGGALQAQAALVATDWSSLRDFLKTTKHFLTAAKRKMEDASRG